MASNSRRLRGFDYASSGAYFVTVCADNRRSLFEDVGVADVIRECWLAIPQHFTHVDTDAFVVMPNHVPGILLIGDSLESMPSVVAWHAKPLRKARGMQAGSLGAIIGSFKSAATRELRVQGLFDGVVWQRNYYERVIRNEDELSRIREFIVINPIRWHLDNDNPHRTPDLQHDLIGAGFRPCVINLLQRVRPSVVNWHANSLRTDARLDRPGYSARHCAYAAT